MCKGQSTMDSRNIFTSLFSGTLGNSRLAEDPGIKFSQTKEGPNQDSWSPSP